MDKLMKDSAKRSEILRKLGFPANPSILTPGGKTIGGGGCLPPVWCPFPMFPPWIPGSAPGPSSSTGEQPQGSSQEAMEDSAVADGESYSEEDVVEPLDDAEALEFVEFDPTVDFPSAWVPSAAMVSFIEKHFNRCVMEDERTAIMNDFLKPDTTVL